ncbi:Mu transposase domain-containing protein [Kitasatospora sp. NBC_01266]|uniref:Mu transposase domain-containing protein n=1 Tax=Kitasatospora sp. NBC_01266 TaxID=2903572 RepID=UPI002E32BA24|nr:IS21 family transposase [Kitasatospora sp. NBC_01266]
MLTKEEYEDVRELQRQGWSISAIARQLGHDRKTVRSYLSGERAVGTRSPARDEFSRFLPYCRQRLSDDPHLPASALFDEVGALGYPGRYSTFTRALRKHQARPACAFCCSVGPGGGDAAPRPADEKIRFEWLELTDPPAQWDGGSPARLLLGSLVRPDRWRAVITEGEEFPQLVEAIDQVLRRLGGTTGRWRFRRVPAVWCPETGRVSPAFAQVAKYYGVTVKVCRSDRVGAADAAHQVAARSWWRTVADGGSLWAAQDSLDRFASGLDGRRHPVGDPTQPTPATALLDLPATPYPLRSCLGRTVLPQGLVAYRGNFYAVPPDLAGAAVQVQRRLGESFLSITTASGAVIARHALAPQGAGLRMVDRGGAIVLDRPARPTRAEVPPCQRGKGHRPLSPAAQAEADALHGTAVPSR